jgi:hypothetical protein
MLYRYLKSVPVLILLLLFHLPGNSRDQHVPIQKLSDGSIPKESRLKDSSYPLNLCADISTDIQLSTFKLPVSVGYGLLSDKAFATVQAAIVLPARRSVKVALYQFYRLLLFPFHAFW